jgi:uncharacterized protein YpmB
MSLSRSESRRRLTTGSLAKWLLMSALLLILAFSLLLYYIRSVDSGYRGEENRAIALAKTEGGLVKIDETVLYTWEEPVWVVRGKDQNGEAWFLWERSDGLVKERLSDGYDESRIRERFAADRPSARVIRVLPGWFKGGPVWEIRYSKAPRSGQQAVDFYSFKDGSLVKTYELPGVS